MVVKENEFVDYGHVENDPTWSKFNSGVFGDYKTVSATIDDNIFSVPSACSSSQRYGVKIINKDET